MRAAFILRVRHRCYEVLDVGSTHDKLSRFVHRILVICILLSVLTVIFESVKSLHEAYPLFFRWMEILACIIFTLEYVLRIWAAVDHPPLRKFPKWRARLLYATQPSLLIDLLAVLPLYLAFFGSSDLQILLIIRLLRFFKLARYSPGMRSLAEAVYAERRALLACLVILGGLMVVAAAAMHMVESAAQPDKFGSIPEAMYWAIITLTTVGYGDVYPVTNAGRVVAGLTAIMGLVMLSLPVGIIATAFAEVIHRRDFVVTWNMLARVPMFASLDAAQIAEIMRFLRSRVVNAGVPIFHKNDVADAMYFITSGAVEVELPHKRIKLEAGQFFGEMAILGQGARSATVRTLETTHLLALDKVDFLALVEKNADIAAHIQGVMQSRTSS
jgi:voltage-gated potassium channel